MEFNKETCKNGCLVIQLLWKKKAVLANTLCHLVKEKDSEHLHTRMTNLIYIQSVSYHYAVKFINLLAKSKELSYNIESFF